MIQLQPPEEELRTTVANKLEESNRAFAEHGLAGDTSSPLHEAGRAAHELHKLLKERGLEPRHHGYMIRNRGVSPDHQDFYMQVHAIQDLLAFLLNPDANKDPEDQTLGTDFEFRVYSKRWGHDDSYRVSRTEDGWNVHHLSIGGPCDTGGHPFLFDCFNQDSISYPSGLDTRLEWLWEEARDKGLSKENVQQALQDLADWVSDTERCAPSSGIWEGF